MAEKKTTKKTPAKKTAQTNSSAKTPTKKVAEVKSRDVDAQVAKEVAKKNNPYRDERGVRINTYRRYKEGVDYEPIEANEMAAIIAMAYAGEKNKMGRPSLFNSVDELEGAIQAYFDYLIETNENYGTRLIPDVEGLACFMGTDRQTLFKWEQNNFKNFGDTIKRAKNIIASCKKQLALCGKIPPIVFATDMNNNHGYTQKQEVIVTPTIETKTAEQLLSEASALPVIENE